MATYKALKGVSGVTSASKVAYGAVNSNEIGRIQSGQIITKWAYTTTSTILFIVPANCTLYVISAFLDSDGDDAYLDLMQPGYIYATDQAQTPILYHNHSGAENSVASPSIPLPIGANGAVRLSSLNSASATGGFTGFLVPNSY